MIKSVLCAGFGGQGIMLMGKLLAYGAIYENLEVTFYPSYGPEMRGGTANCTVVISSERVGSPIKNSFDIVIAMNQSSVDKFSSTITPGGFLIYNQPMVTDSSFLLDEIAIGIPANDIAIELGAPQASNMVALGGMLPKLDVLSIESIYKSLPNVLSSHRDKLIPINKKAIKKGYEFTLANTN
jgi:2-oxoglutarate ferredoxin oxidoreductase subunit gamma